MSEDLRIKGGAVPNSFHRFIIIIIIIIIIIFIVKTSLPTSLPTLFFTHRIDQEHPTTVICKISVRRTCCLEFSNKFPTIF